MVGVVAGIAFAALLVACVLWGRWSKARFERELGELGGKRGFGGKNDFAFFYHLGKHPRLKSFAPAPLQAHLAENGLLLQLGWRRLCVPLDDIVEASIEVSVPSGKRAEDLVGDEMARKLLGQYPHLHLEVASHEHDTSVLRLAIQGDDARLCAEAIVREVRSRRGHPEPEEAD